MTKEELEKEAKEDVDSLNSIDLVSSTMIAIDKYGAYKLGRYDGYLASAEPREKRIAELEDKLANADYQLEGRDLEIKELKAQIEKMKCCFNCKHSRTEYEHCRTDKHEKWEIKENG